MTKWQRTKEKMQTAVAYLIAVLGVVGAALAALFFYFLPKRDQQKRREAAHKAAALRTKVAQVQAERQAKVDQQVAVVKEETKAAQAQDPVDFANALIDAEKKS